MNLTPQQASALKALVVAEPSLAAAVQAGNLHAIREWLGAASIPQDRDVPVVEARKIVLLSGELAAVKLAAEARPVTALTPVAITFVETMADRDTIVPAAAKNGVAQMLGALVDANLLSGGSRDALLALFSSAVAPFESVVGRGKSPSLEDVSQILRS